MLGKKAAQDIGQSVALVIDDVGKLHMGVSSLLSIVGNIPAYVVR